MSVPTMHLGRPAVTSQLPAEGAKALPSFSILRRRDPGAKRERLLKQIAERAESGRRLAIYEQQAGFLAPWYMRLRVSEECARSTRYACPLSVMVVQPEAAADAISDWLRRALRSTDLVSRTPEGTFVVLLTETDADGASEVMKRVLAEVPVTRVWGAAFLTDPDRFSELVAALESGSVHAPD